MIALAPSQQHRTSERPRRVKGLGPGAAGLALHRSLAGGAVLSPRGCSPPRPRRQLLGPQQLHCPPPVHAALDEPVELETNQHGSALLSLWVDFLDGFAALSDQRPRSAPSFVRSPPLRMRLARPRHFTSCGASSASWRHRVSLVGDREVPSHVAPPSASWRLLAPALPPPASPPL